MNDGVYYLLLEINIVQLSRYHALISRKFKDGVKKSTLIVFNQNGVGPFIMGG